MSQVKRSDFSINSIIGPGTSLTGNIEVNGFIRIDGSIRGDVKAGGRVVIGERARIKGDVSGTNMTIGGVVYGNVISDGHLVILSTALILGNIITRRIQADNGCFIHGMIKVCTNDETWSQTVFEYQDEQGIRSALPVFQK